MLGRRAVALKELNGLGFRAVEGLFGREEAWGLGRLGETADSGNQVFVSMTTVHMPTRHFRVFSYGWLVRNKNRTSKPLTLNPKPYT